MSSKGPKPIKRRLFNAYLISTLSITLVLFLIGFLVLVMFNANYLNKYIRENIGLTLVLNEEVREVDLLQLQKLLASQPEVKLATVVDAETAAINLSEELGEDFIGFLGYNPLHATIDVKLFAAYTSSDSLLMLEEKFTSFANVEEVYYQKNLINLINKNSNKIGMVILGVSIVMLLIFFALINNTIRLSIYANRFTINTMQLVGATRSFIRQPFVSKSILQGILGALLSNILLLSLMVAYNKQFNEIIQYDNTSYFFLVFAIVLISGLVLSWLSTTMAVNKFLRLKYDELFY